MAFQNINQYPFKKLFLKPVREVYDLTLASDEKNFDQEVIFSSFLIGENDGNRLPLNFDFDNPNITNCINCGDFENDVVVSKNFWNPVDSESNNCDKILDLCDVGLTGIDNGLVQNISGETIQINSGLYTTSSETYSRYYYDRRFKMHPITGFTTYTNRIVDDNSYDYSISEENDNDDVGKYIRFNGGFYQGFYKLSEYDYEVLPERFNWGWSTEFLLRYRWTGDTNVGLNYRYPSNKGTFFYYGTRAENKFYHYADGSPSNFSGYSRVTEGLNCLETCGCFDTGNTNSHCSKIYQQSASTSSYCNCTCNCNCNPTSGTTLELNPLFDSVSNALSIRLSGDTGNPKICIKTLRITGGCETTGTCTTGITYNTGTSLTEWCSSGGIFDVCLNDTSYFEKENWVQIDVVFVRNKYLEECDLEYKGGLGDIVKSEFLASLSNNSASLIQPSGETESGKTQTVKLTEQWIDEIEFRKGKLKIYINGKLFSVIDDFEEIIPRPLNTSKEKQIGVPFNISLGGGTQGLHDNLTFFGCVDNISNIILQQDPELLTNFDLQNTIYSALTTNIRLSEDFGGNFIGDISAFRFYSEPLNAAQISHNFRLLKERYNLLDPDCPYCSVPEPSQTPSVTSTPTVTPTNTLTPFFTPTVTTTPTVTPTTTPSPTPSFTPTPTTTIGLTPTQTPTQSQTPTLTPTPSTTPATPYRAYLFIEPVSGSNSIGLWMYDKGSDFFGFTNESQPSQDQSTFDFDMNTYVDFSGWTTGEFPTIFQQSVPQVSGGVDDFDNPIVAFNFKTTEVPAYTVFGEAWFTWIIPIILTNNKKQIEIDLNNTGNPNILTAVKTEPTLYEYTFNYTGTTLPNTVYRVYTTYPNLIFKLNNIQNIYFRGNSIQ